MHAVKNLTQFLDFALVNGLDGALILGSGILDKVENVFAVLVVEGVATTNVLELNGSANVACLKLVNVALCQATAHGVELSDALFATAVHVVKVGTGLDGTAHYLEIRNLANVGLNGGLEEEDACGTIRVALNFVALGVAHGGHLSCGGNYFAQEVHQAVYAHVLLTADAHYWDDAAVDKTLAHTIYHFLGAEGVFLKEFFHESFVALGGHLNESHVKLLGAILISGVNVGNSALATVAVIVELLHHHHVNYALETSTG